MKKNVIVGQSGGPTAVINASLYGVVYEALMQKEQIGTVYGMINGIEGFLADTIMDMNSVEQSGELELIKTTPGSFLGSCRYKLPEDLKDDVYPLLFKKFEEYSIGYFFYIGGNDSMDTVSKLSRYADKHNNSIRFIGIPKTIDNDLVLTDHTPGYGSAAKYVASTVREICLDASVYQTPAVTIVEIMGRHAGWLTAASVLARKHELDNPLLIYLPESDFDLQEFSRDLTNALHKQPNVVVCVSEGISDAGGRFICEYNTDATALDTFGHKMLAGCGKVLENYVRSTFGVKARSVELNVSQRCSGMIASLTDIEEAAHAGAIGVSNALNGATGMMVSMKRSSGSPYSLEYVLEDVNEICNKEKKFPLSWITNHGTDIGPEFQAYAIPLIQGEPARVMDHGLPVYLHR